MIKNVKFVKPKKKYSTDVKISGDLSNVNAPSFTSVIPKRLNEDDIYYAARSGGRSAVFAEQFTKAYIEEMMEKESKDDLRVLARDMVKRNMLIPISLKENTIKLIYNLTCGSRYGTYEVEYDSLKTGSIDLLKSISVEKQEDNDLEQKIELKLRECDIRFIVQRFEDAKKGMGVYDNRYVKNECRIRVFEQVRSCLNGGKYES